MSSKQHEQSPDPARRRFVVGALTAGGGALLTAVAGCKESGAPAPIDSADAPAPSVLEPTLPDNKDPANFIKHGDNPLTLETRREKLGTSVLTATSAFFVRQNCRFRRLRLLPTAMAGPRVSRA